MAKHDNIEVVHMIANRLLENRDIVEVQLPDQSWLPVRAAGLPDQSHLVLELGEEYNPPELKIKIDETTKLRWPEETE